MANQEHLDILKQGVKIWNKWRQEHPEIEPDLNEANLGVNNLSGMSRMSLSEARLSGEKLNSVDFSRTNMKHVNLRLANLNGAIFDGADLMGAILHLADLSGATLIEADLSGADLRKAVLSKTNLSKAILFNADLSGANLTGANLIEADLHRADLLLADLSGANLSGANLSRAVLLEVNLKNALLTNCLIYGISAWDVQLEGAKQDSLVITQEDEPTITVDNLKIAQFIYLLLNNQEIREAIDAIASKVVLILGRFTSERKIILDAIRDELRKRNYTPVLFDFEKPASRDLTETVSILAHLARFIIVDLTDPSSAPHEVATIIPHCIVPVQPLLLQDDTQPRHEYAMFHNLRTRYHWVLPTYQYKDIAGLLASLKESIIDPAEQKAQELAKR